MMTRSGDTVRDSTGDLTIIIASGMLMTKDTPKPTRTTSSVAQMFSSHMRGGTSVADCAIRLGLGRRYSGMSNRRHASSQTAITPISARAGANRNARRRMLSPPSW
jgi:hypothetical protein